jgi:hypothetical protein
MRKSFITSLFNLLTGAQFRMYASGDVHTFAQYVYSTVITGLPVLWASDTLKGGIVTNATVPAITTADPRWGAGGTTNFSTNEVTPGGAYSAGGITLTSPTVTLSSANINLNVTSPISLASNASNPTGAYWMIIYSSTAAGKQCVGYIDLGGPISLVSGLQININGASSGVQIFFQGTAQ